MVGHGVGISDSPGLCPHSHTMAAVVPRHRILARLHPKQEARSNTGRGFPPPLPSYPGGKSPPSPLPPASHGPEGTCMPAPTPSGEAHLSWV